MSDGQAARPLMPRGLVVVLLTTGLLVTSLALRQFQSVVAPVLLALVLVIGVYPISDRLRRRGAPQWAATAVALVVALVIIIGLAASLAVSVARLGTLLPTYQDRFVALLNQLQAWLAGLGVGADQLRTVLAQIDFGQVAGVLTSLLSGLAGVFSDLVFIVFVVLFMGIDAAGFTRRLAEVGAEKAPVVDALGGFVRGTRNYLVVSTVFGLIVAALDGIFLWIVGVPLAALWALLAFVTNYIPNIGFIIGLVPPALLALLEGGPGLMILVIVVYSLLNFVIQSVIQPKFVGDAVDISLTLTFLSLVFWSFVIGPLGAILAIPLTLLAKALLVDVDPSTRWISALFAGGSAGVPPPGPEPSPEPEPEPEPADDPPPA
jgi:AI-2 transport protein TqsA